MSNWQKNLFIITCFIKIVYYSLLINQIDHNLTLRVVNYFHEHSLIKLITWRFLECMIFLKRPAADLYPSLSLGDTHVFRLCEGQHPPGLRTWFFLSFLKKNKKCKLIFLKCIVETKMGSHYIPLTSQFREGPPTMVWEVHRHVISMVWEVHMHGISMEWEVLRYGTGFSRVLQQASRKKNN